jgi:hypothetical protein
MNNQLHFKWEVFSHNLRSSLQDIRNKGELFDVTLVCDDGQIQCHKLVLSASSDFFRNLFNKHSLPLIFLGNVKVKELKDILDFMYNGQVNIEQEHIELFMNTAEILKVKGLYIPNPEKYLEAASEVGGNQEHPKESDAETNSSPKSTRPSSMNEMLSSAPSTVPGDHHFLSQDSNSKQTTNDSIPTTELPSCYFTCDICFEVLKDKKLLQRHKKKHSGTKFPCDVCGKVFNRKDTMVSHKQKIHNN